jgi:hypothetical protein
MPQTNSHIHQGPAFDKCSNLVDAPTVGHALLTVGNSQVNPATLTITDKDNAVTGGTGQYLGAYGDFKYAANVYGNNTVTEAEFTIYGPKNKL